MLQEAIDFRDECDAFYALLDSLDDQDWERKTQFKQWTINDVVAHLHFGDYAAGLSLKDGAAFTAFLKEITTARAQGMRNQEFTHSWLKGAKHRSLLDRWRRFYRELAEVFFEADPKARVLWFGPSMSARSSITARLMETWAHGQAIYDLLGKTRDDTDRIKNIAVIGINTFGWSFTNRHLPVPAKQPYVRLTAPSGVLWEWHEPDRDNLIEGSGVEFCQVVTQVRNIADTRLKVVGETAAFWMSIAQCFAGPPENPPAPGSRFKQG
jgi:uncharacterized protein (TIGR03084 family)